MDNKKRHERVASKDGQLARLKDHSQPDTNLKTVISPHCNSDVKTDSQRITGEENFWL